jgi:CubicO group peptidase (beta-lactamase class C family)
MLLPLLSLAAALLADSTPPRPIPPPTAPRHELTEPGAVQMRLSELLRAEQSVEEEVSRGAFPGAALAIGRWDRTVVERGIGKVSWTGPAVDPDLTVYDLASLTKVVATTTAVMLLVEDGRLELDAPVSRYLPAFSGGAKDRVTIRHLLTHTSGLPDWIDLWGPTPERALERVLAVGLEVAPGQRVEYSDVGFVVLWAAAERANGAPLYRLLDERVFGPLGMRSTTFLPGEWCERCAPTDRRPDGTKFRGVVHDPTARRLGGITGNAGLFSTVHDLSRFAAMLASGGELEGVRVLREQTIREFTRRQPGAGTRALGWDTPSPRGGGAAGLRISQQGFGHTGFTGTSLWVDPDRGTWTILLANRTYAPKASNRIQALRRDVHDRVASAVDQEQLER